MRSAAAGAPAAPRAAPIGEKRKMFAEMRETLSRDPLSIRFLRPWLWSLLPRHSPVHDRLPWMNFKVTQWLRSYLRPTMEVFEYGAGGSTLFLAQRVRRLVTVEHDSQWHALVARALRAAGIPNCDLRLVPAVSRTPSREPVYGPSSFSSRTPHARGLNFESYVRAIDAEPDGSLDLVLVDGYARFSCVAHAVPKVRHGGYLVFDDTDLPKYREAVAFLDRFPRRDFVGVTPFQRNLRQTTIWRL